METVKIINLNIANIFNNKSKENSPLEIYNELLNSDADYVRYEVSQGENKIYPLIKEGSSLYVNTIGFNIEKNNLIINDEKSILIIDLDNNNKIRFENKFNNIKEFKFNEKEYNASSGFIWYEGNSKLSIDQNRTTRLNIKTNQSATYFSVISYFKPDKIATCRIDSIFDKIIEDENYEIKSFQLNTLFYKVFKENNLEIKIPESYIEEYKNKSSLEKLMLLADNKKILDENKLPLFYSIEQFNDFLNINKESLEIINVLHDKNIIKEYEELLEQYTLLKSFYESYKNIHNYPLSDNTNIFFITKNKIFINSDPDFSNKTEMECYNLVEYLKENKILENCFKNINLINNFNYPTKTEKKTIKI